MNTIFKDLATMVHEQGEMVDSIEVHVSDAQVRVEEGTQQLRQVWVTNSKILNSESDTVKPRWKRKSGQLKQFSSPVKGCFS